MSKYCIDTSAWVEYFEDTSHAEKIQKLLDNPTNEILSSIYTVAELANIFNRRGKDGKEAVNAMMSLSNIINLDIPMLLEAAELHAKQRMLTKTFGMGDAIIFVSAKSVNATLVTVDEHFKGLKGVMYLK